MTTDSAMSRRRLLSAPLLRFRRAAEAAMPRAANAETSAAPADLRAVIQGRLCLAYRNEFCTLCYERCPGEGAMRLLDGRPQVVLDKCTGCRVCQDVCPAPRNAILMLPPRPLPGAPAPVMTELAVNGGA